MPAASKAIALVVLIGPVLAFAAAPAPAPAPVTIQVQPRELRLAEGGRVRVRVASPEPPRIAVSTGRIEGLREVSSGIYQAEYAPPDGVDPDIAFVTAVTPSGGFGWSTIALDGSRTVEVRAPHRTLVAVAVGDEQYGPVPADATGRSVLRVDVPPGVHHGTSLGRKVALDVVRRTFSHVHVDRPAVEAGATTSVVVRVIALDELGHVAPHAAVRLEPSEGSVSRPVEIAPGVFHSVWNIGSGAVRQMRITAHVGTKIASTATAILKRTPGAPAAVQVDTDRMRLVAGEGDELKVTGRVVDTAGNTTDAPARLVVSMGTGDAARLLPDAVIDWQQTSAGYVGRVQVPRQRSGRQQLELKVIAAGGLVGTRVVDLVPGEPVSLSVEPEEDLYADGRSRQLRLVLLDKHGNRTDAAGNAEVTATRGTVGAPVRLASGAYVVDYSSPLSARDYLDVIHARVGPLEGQSEVRVRARGSTVVLGLKGGYTAATGSLSSADGGVELGFWRPALRTSLGLVFEAGYFSLAKDHLVPAGGSMLPVGSEISFLALELSLAWRRPLLTGMFWLGAGPGLVRASTSATVQGQPDITTTYWDPTVHASVGWGRPLGPGIPFVEVKGAWQGEADTGPVFGTIKTLTFNVGYRFDVL